MLKYINKITNLCVLNTLNKLMYKSQKYKKVSVKEAGICIFLYASRCVQLNGTNCHGLVLKYLHMQRNSDPLWMTAGNAKYHCLPRCVFALLHNHKGVKKSVYSLFCSSLVEENTLL